MFSNIRRRNNRGKRRRKVARNHPGPRLFSVYVHIVQGSTVVLWDTRDHNLVSLGAVLTCDNQQNVQCEKYQQVTHQAGMKTSYCIGPHTCVYSPPRVKKAYCMNDELVRQDGMNEESLHKK